MLTAACTVPKKAVNDAKQLGFTYNYCTPTVTYLQSTTVWPDTPNTDLSYLPVTAHDRLICHILGISNEVDSLWHLSKIKTPGDVNSYLLLKQKINGRLLTVQSQIQALAAELDCEGERSNLAAGYLDNINSRKKNNLTVASVVIGALTTVGTVIGTHKASQTAIGISGGLLSAGLGALTISPKGKKIEFYHERNLLRSIWTEPSNNTDYPYFVWQMLHEKQLSNSGNITLSQSIRNQWLQFEFDGKISKKQEDLLFGKGGFYHADDLHTRTAMINQLQSTIRSFYQDLSSFIVVVESK